jgi:hypothetical protein
MEEKEIITSKKYTLDLRDAAKGLVMAVTTAVLMAVETSLEAGEIAINYQKIGVAGGLAAIAYLLKNFFTKAEVKKQAQ